LSKNQIGLLYVVRVGVTIELVKPILPVGKSDFQPPAKVTIFPLLNLSMSAIQLELIPHQTADGLTYQHLRIRITNPDGIVEPSDLRELKLPDDLKPSLGVVIEGRAPIWLYGYLVHECHATAWVGCFDPRLEGAVVVEAHARGVTVGSVVKLTLPK